jgi:hypothetical protein
VKKLSIAAVGAVVLGLAGPASATVQEHTTPASTATLNSEILSWVKGRYPGNAGYPVTWKESVKCRLPKEIQSGLKFECAVLFDEPGHQPLLNEGTVKVTITDLRLTRKGVYSSNSSVVASIYPYTPPTTTTVAPTTTLSPTTTSTTSVSIGYKAKCRTIAYAELVKDPSSHKGKCFTFVGTVFQYDSKTGSDVMLVETGAAVASGYGLVQVDLLHSSMGASVVEGDSVQFWGPFLGVNTYKTENNGTNTVPEIEAKYLVQING